MTKDDKNDLIDILHVQIGHIKQKAKSGEITEEEKNQRIEDANRTIALINYFPENESSYREKGREEFANRLIEIIKDYRDRGCTTGQLDSSEEYNCNRIKYFTERLRDTWDEPRKQVFI